MEAARHIVRLWPIAVELIDRTMIDSRGREPQSSGRRWTNSSGGTPAAILLVEFGEDNYEENLRRLRQFKGLIGDLGFGWDKSGDKGAAWVEVLSPELQAVTEVRTRLTAKATLMERFDELVTDRDVRLGDVEAHLAAAGPTDLFRGRYRVAATGGTTGRRGVFLADRSEWTSVLASYARANDWAGVPAGLLHRLRVAVVSSRNPTHQSSIVGATLASVIVPTLRLDAADPLERTIEALNSFRPDSLVGYASVLRVLAGEQLAGRLAIAPGRS